MNEPNILQSAECQHEEFEANVDVNRLTEREGGNVSSFVADIRIKCAKCGAPMHFVGVDGGFSFQRPMTSIDALELRAPLGVGPIIPKAVQTIEVPVADFEGTDAQQDDSILASSDDPNQVSDAEFERRAAAELTKEPPNGNDAKQ